ncbi:MAG: type II secretion system protein GspM [Gammaproteobacteria bacterium]
MIEPPRVGTVPSRVLALVILASLVLLVFAALIRPLTARYLDNRGAIEQLSEQIARMRAISSQTQAYRAELDRLRQDPRRERYLLGEESPTLAAASLQERLKSVVEQHGGRLTSTQVMGAEEDGGFAKVAIAARVSGDISVLQRTLHDLEGSLPLLTVDDLTVLSRRSRRRNSPAQVLLDVRFTLYGFMLSRAAGTTG